MAATLTSATSKSGLRVRLASQIVLWHHPGVGAGGALAVLADGRLASGVQDGTIKLWAKDLKSFADKPDKVLPHDGQVIALAVLSDGGWPVPTTTAQLSSGRRRVRASRWRSSGTAARSLRWRPCRMGGWPAVAATAQLSCGREGRNRRAGGGPPAPASPVSSLAALPDGRLAPGGDDGTIKFSVKNVKGFAERAPENPQHRAVGSLRWLCWLMGGWPAAAKRDDRALAHGCGRAGRPLARQLKQRL